MAAITFTKFEYQRPNLLLREELAGHKSPELATWDNAEFGSSVIGSGLDNGTRLFEDSALSIDNVRHWYCPWVILVKIVPDLSWRK